MRSAVLSAALFAGMASAHIGLFHQAAYCLDGNDESRKFNSDSNAQPLYQLQRYGGWWFHGVDGCDQRPPPAGTFLELPAGGSFMVELAANRGKTKQAFDGAFVTEWGDGLRHPVDYNDPNCIQSPQLHTKDRSGVAGSSFAIAYVSDISQVTMENLVVFTTNYDTPWLREAWFQVPADLPPCPPDGCICSWNWIPTGCGQPNMYMNGIKCKVTGSTSTKVVGTAKPAVWCEDDPSKCVTGPKQIMVWNQAEGNNIYVDGRQKDGNLIYPAYNHKCGFTNGPQNDIFVEGGSGNPLPSNPPPVESPAPSSPVDTPAPSSPVDNPTPSSPVNNPAPNPPVDSPKPTPPVNSPTPPNPPVENPSPPANPSPNPPVSNPTPPVNTPPSNPNPSPEPPSYVPGDPNGSPAPSSPPSAPPAVPTKKCRRRTPEAMKRALNKRVRHKRRSHDL